MGTDTDRLRRCPSGAPPSPPPRQPRGGGGGLSKTRRRRRVRGGRRSTGHFTVRHTIEELLGYYNITPSLELTTPRGSLFENYEQF